MADVNISKYRASIVRDGSKPASPGFVVSEGQDPVNPPGTNNFVPYTGATANVELGEYGLESGFVTLDTTPTNTPTDQGTIYWDDTRSTAALIMNGTLQHIGQDSFFYVKNSSGSTIPKGTCVGFAGTDGASGHLLVTPFLANGSVPSTYFMGVTSEEIANGAFGQVMHFGELEGINTSGFTAGALLYASTTVAGGFQTTVPVAPNNIVLVAAAVNSKNNGAIMVRPTLGSNINLDEGVKITSPTTGDLLQLQAGGLWENKTKAQILGGTSSQFVKGDGSLDSTSYQPLLTNPVTGTGTTNYLPKFTGITTIGDSIFTEVGGNTLRIVAANAALRLTGSREYLLQTVDADGRFRIYDQTAALERVTLTSAGNVGIGTNSPTVRLDVSTTSGENYIRVNSAANQDSGYRIAEGGTNKWLLYNVAASDAFAIYDNTAVAERLRITSSGNVLIGTTTDAGYKLNVAGEISLDSYLRHNGDTDTFFGFSGNDEIKFTTTGIDRLLINFSGNVGIGTTTPDSRIHAFVSSGSIQTLLKLENGSATASSGTKISFTEGGAERAAIISQINTGTTPYLSFENNGAERWRITSAGILQSNGAQTIQTSTGNLTLATAAGNGDIVLTPNGTGIALIQNSVVGNIARFLSNTANGQQLTILSTATGVQIRSAFSTGIAGSFEIFASGGSSTLSFGTASTERMRITSTGNLGIGTTAPRSLADVNGILTVGDANPPALNLYRNVSLGNNAGFGSISFGARYDATNYGIGASISTNSVGVWSSTNYGGNLIFSTTAQNSTTLTERMRITSAGFVGISETTPLVPLHISRNSSSTGENLALLLDNNDTTAGSQIGILFRSFVGSTNTDFQISGKANSANAMDLLFLSDGATERMRITSTGNVLIGTTTSGASKLRIVGLPTSSSGLSSGDIWNDGGTLKIV